MVSNEVVNPNEVTSPPTETVVHTDTVEELAAIVNDETQPRDKRFFAGSLLPIFLLNKCVGCSTTHEEPR